MYIVSDFLHRPTQVGSLDEDKFASKQGKEVFSKKTNLDFERNLNEVSISSSILL
jgi:hypothetical protein